MLEHRRVVRCRACGHTGTIAIDAALNAKIRCIACGEKFRVRQCTGEHPARWCPPSAGKKAKTAAAREVIERYGNNDLNDDIADLWPRKTA
jgi:hypothetical protein